jgi:hypothetical protein
MTTGSFQPRRLGSHLLIGQLGEDCLGSVYRSLHATDERRFVRLRILQSPELSPPAIFSAIARHGESVSRLSHKAIVQQAELAISEGTPYYAWYENAGWTLDVVLSRLRAADTPLPMPFALLIAERVCAALKHAWFSPVEGAPLRHGLLWPGFISISNDAEIRLGGFGLAEGVLPTLSVGRLAREIAPYLAAEARATGQIGPTSDSYSAGVLLLELLSCRRPSPSASDAILGSEDHIPEGIRSLLNKCFAAPSDRISVLELHRALQDQLAAMPAPVSSADLALFLYTLLNPESRSAPATDGESTNPISAEKLDADRPVAARCAEPSSIEVRPAHETTHAGETTPSFALVRVSRPAPPPRFSSRWLQGTVYFGAVAMILVGVNGLAFHRGHGRGAAAKPASPTSHPPVLTSLRSVPAPAPATEPDPESLILSGLVPAKVDGQAGAPKTAVVAAVRRTRSDRDGAANARGTRREAEDGRFQAAWARIEAERGEAGHLAAEAFAKGRSAEVNGDRLLRRGAYARAREAFGTAAEYFHQAGNASRQARLDRIQLSSPSF